MVCFMLWLTGVAYFVRLVVKAATWTFGGNNAEIIDKLLNKGGQNDIVCLESKGCFPDEVYCRVKLDLGFRHEL